MVPIIVNIYIFLIHPSLKIKKFVLSKNSLQLIVAKRATIRYNENC